jgi:hypothetical protein
LNDTLFCCSVPSDFNNDLSADTFGDGVVGGTIAGAGIAAPALEIILLEGLACDAIGAETATEVVGDWVGLGITNGWVD